MGARHKLSSCNKRSFAEGRAALRIEGLDFSAEALLFLRRWQMGLMTSQEVEQAMIDVALLRGQVPVAINVKPRNK